ncbi:hypothetical protein TNCV_570951 [Trichonephila clavipes]|nr:hypothetical protein TNCV_570951 [Trichonephila clavipes]
MGNILEATILSGKLQGEVVLLPQIQMILSDSPTHSNVRNFHFTRYGHTLSGFRQNRQCLPHGAVLSPILFHLMVDDLINLIPRSVPGINILLFADDMMMSATEFDISGFEDALQYPLDKWFHVYKYGSEEDAIKNAGAEAYSNAFSISYPVGKYCDNFDESVVLQWTRSHYNISGNEKADKLTKAGSLMSQPDSALSLRNIKRIVYSKLQINSLYGDATADSACCPQCHQGEMEGDHLRHFPNVSQLFVDNSTETNFNSFYASSSFYWAARRLMAEMPKLGVEL